MARHQPNTRYQNFFEEAVVREDRARLNFWRENSAGGEGFKRKRGSAAYLVKGLPSINPQQFAKDVRNVS